MKFKDYLKKKTNIFVDGNEVDELINSKRIYTWFKLKNGNIIKVKTADYDNSKRPLYLTSI